VTSVPNDKPATCPVCKEADHSTFFMRKEGYDLFQCTECQHIFVWPVPTVEVLQHIYSFAAGFQVQPSTTYDENTTAHQKNRESLIVEATARMMLASPLPGGCLTQSFPIWRPGSDQYPNSQAGRMSRMHRGRPFHVLHAPELYADPCKSSHVLGWQARRQFDVNSAWFWERRLRHLNWQ
jgi:Zn ribbon nucleic-acid-binding protein